MDGATVKVTDPAGKVHEVVAQNLKAGATSAKFPFVVVPEISAGTWTVEGKTFDVVSTDATLSGVTTDVGIWDKDFADDKLAYDNGKAAATTYNVYVEADVSAVKFTPEAAEGSTITAKYNDKVQVLDNGKANTITLDKDHGTDAKYDIDITVIAPDKKTTKDYKFKVEKAEVNAKDDATLSALTVGSLVVSTNVKDSYSTIVKSNVEKVDVTPAETDTSKAKIFVNGEKYSATKSIDLKTGDNEIEIKVVAANHKTSKVYTVNVTRAEKGASSIKTLNSITLSDGTLSEFKADKDASTNGLLTTKVPNKVEDITITPVATNSDAKIDVTAIYDRAQGQTPTPTAANKLEVVKNSDGISYTVKGLKVSDVSNDNYINISVTPADADKAEVYSVKVERVSNVAKDIAELATLISDNANVKLSEDFKGTVEEYSYNVKSEADTINFTPRIIADSKATITINGEEATTAQASTQKLKVGENIFKIKVLAEDAVTERTYTVVVNRASTSASSEAKLSSLGLSAGKLDPVFKETTESYAVRVLNKVEDLTITPIAKDSNAVVKVKAVKGTNLTTKANALEVVQNGNAWTIKGLAAEVNTIEVSVQPENAATAKTYELTVTRVKANASDNALLRTMKIEAPNHVLLGTDWDKYKNAFTVDKKVPYTQNTVKVTAAGETDSNTEITINGNKATTADASPLKVGENVIKVKVTAPNGIATNEYTFKVTRLDVTASNEAGLGKIESSEGNLTGDAIKETVTGTEDKTSSHSLAIPFAVDSTKLTVTPADKNAKVEVTNASEKLTITDNKDGTYTIADLKDGENILVKVTSEDQKVNYTATIQVKKADKNASKEVRLEGINSVDKFTVDTKSYAWKVKNATSTIDLDVKKLEDKQEVSYVVNGTEYTGLATSVPLNPGLNTIEINVLAEDRVATGTYKLEVTRVDANLNIDTELKIDGKTDNSPSFKANVLATESSYTFKPTVPSGATMKISAKNKEGVTIPVPKGENGNYTVYNLTTGDNVVTIEVTAEDGVTTKSYTLTTTPDTTAPEISSVKTSTVSGAYKSGTVIEIKVKFNEVVTVAGTPVLKLADSLTDAKYTTGSGTDELTFKYTVGASDNSDNLNVTSIDLSGGSIKDAADNPATLTLVGNELSSSSGIEIDTIAPSITGVSIADGDYKVGDDISVTITADAAGYTAGTITVNGQNLSAFNDEDNKTYTGTYTVVEGDIDRANVGAIPISVVLTDAAGNSNSAYDDSATGTVTIDANSPMDPTEDTTADKTGTTQNANFDIVVNAETDAIVTAKVGGTDVLTSGAVTAENSKATLPIDITKLSEGANAIDIVVTDAAGNASDPLRVNVTKDTTIIGVTTPAFTAAGVGSTNISDSKVTWTDSSAEEAPNFVDYYVLVGAENTTAAQVKTLFDTKAKLDDAVTGNQAMKVVATSSDEGTTGVTFGTDLTKIAIDASGVAKEDVLAPGVAEFFVITIDKVGNIDVQTTSGTFAATE